VRDDVVLAEDMHRETRSHTASLPGLVDRVLARAGAALADVDAIAVSIGPGSFTGLRVGLGLAKGIAYAGGLRVAAVPTLEALASVADAAPGETICAALDARKREVYAALFRATGGRPERLSPDAALAPDVLAAQLPAGTVLVGDAGEVYGPAFAGRARVLPFATFHPRGGAVARLGYARLVAGAAADVGPLEPVYVRAPDAQLPGSK
jgi:tRNA threonylcarbamoyladenosine biosynthesis protein TsaB